MQLIPVSSSDIRAIGYDNNTATLFVVFHSGGTYQYFDVPEYVHVAFMNAGSKGQFLHQNIKYQYRYQRVG